MSRTDSCVFDWTPNESVMMLTRHLYAPGDAVNAKAALMAAVFAAAAAGAAAAADQNGTNSQLTCHQVLSHPAHWPQMPVAHWPQMPVVQGQQHAVPAAADALQLQMQQLLLQLPGTVAAGTPLLLHARRPLDPDDPGRICHAYIAIAAEVTPVVQLL